MLFAFSGTESDVKVSYKSTVIITNQLPVTITIRCCNSTVIIVHIPSISSLSENTHTHYTGIVPALFHIASYPGPSQKKGEGLVYTVCACAKLPQVFIGIRITPYLTVDYICGLFVNVHFIAWVWLYRKAAGCESVYTLFHRCRLRSDNSLMRVALYCV